MHTRFLVLFCFFFFCLSPRGNLNYSISSTPPTLSLFRCIIQPYYLRKGCVLGAEWGTPLYNSFHFPRFSFLFGLAIFTLRLLTYPLSSLFVRLLHHFAIQSILICIYHYSLSIVRVCFPYILSLTLYCGNASIWSFIIFIFPLLFSFFALLQTSTSNPRLFSFCTQIVE